MREDLTPRVRARTWALGIVLVLVDGDLQDHIEFHEPYDAFVAPHYEADVHREGGAFWGRASKSATPAADDRLGGIFWRRYSQLVGRPPDRFGWLNPNVTDYYGFRLTDAKTPGILVEHGVGAPGAPDHDWLRANVDAIADAWALALAEFGSLDSLTQVHGTEEEMDQDLFNRWFDARLKESPEYVNTVKAIKDDIDLLDAKVETIGNVTPAAALPATTLTQIAATTPAPPGYHWVGTRLVADTVRP